MFKHISILSAAAALLATPLAAQTVSPGHDMIARINGVDASAYTLNELAQIEAEKGAGAPGERAAFIAAQKQAPAARAGTALQLLGGAAHGFTANEWAQIQDEDSDSDRRDRARFILEQRSVGTQAQPGADAVARRLGVEGLGFTANELAQIDDEDSAGARRDRARFILEQKADS
ncbi:hypothetical protein GI374_06170 [Paracoccus sp. S-4012]|uniref:hypothetical protein n=1 Tax=Paracoccus sp. S-4012 TaxID=2665648 RepID=UPI0012AF4F48|nr:hypothetical protein [Paracoccus sp. S-4012]MRX50043.1 hypothetical protein [Paracoccus sp. S-4012]